MTTPRVLLAEDEAPKRDRLLRFLSATYAGASVLIAKSVRTAMALIRKEPLDALVLDMSLPTFDISSGEPGGRPQAFGGIELLRLLECEELKVPAVIVTQYPVFTKKDGSDLDLKELDRRLRRDHAENYRGIVYYNSVLGGWETDLRAKLAQVLGDEADANSAGG